MSVWCSCAVKSTWTAFLKALAWILFAQLISIIHSPADTLFASLLHQLNQNVDALCG